MSVTIYNIAERCHCSTTTVSKVLNGKGKISEKKKKEIMEAAKDLGYIPSKSAISLASTSKASKLIGVILHISEDKSFTHEAFSKVLNSFRIKMESNDYDICFLRNLSNDDEIDYLTLIKARGLDGVFMLSADIHDEKVKKLTHDDIPYVTFDMLNTKYYVSSNNQEVVADLVDYLVSLGHRRICFVHPHNYEIAQERYLGFLKGLKRNNIPLEDGMIIYAPYYCHDSAKITVEKVLESNYHPTVIMFQDDYTAIDAIPILRSHNLKVPNDISITGFDGISITRSIRPSLTTIKQDCEKIGLEAAELLLKQIKKEKIDVPHVIVDAQIEKCNSVLDLKNKGDQ